ncbi:hypothetical protein [Tychonema sp. LEGE 07203]|uniref:hypothetical protein n=1 Tax=Tychonema sp. LEGE 07203 TaxID=1828671 RepID=UPI0018820839|nr:hypothetical protein [Tychonema sp. LEGE 07203]MBE9096687.1 hypothetical protein [Tychonema sp. LEGE 07203]
MGCDDRAKQEFDRYFNFDRASEHDSNAIFGRVEAAEIAGFWQLSASFFAAKSSRAIELTLDRGTDN